MRANAVMEYSFDAINREHCWTFGGKAADVNFAEPDGNSVLTARAASHGFKQKIADAAAKGQTATTREKRDAMQKVVDALNNGDWAAERESAGSDLAQIIAAVDGKPVAKIAAYLKGLTAAQKTALGALPRYAEERQRRVDAAVARVDLASLEKGLDEV